MAPNANAFPARIRRIISGIDNREDPSTGTEPASASASTLKASPSSSSLSKPLLSLPLLRRNSGTISRAAESTTTPATTSSRRRSRRRSADRSGSAPTAAHVAPVSAAAGVDESRCSYSTNDDYHSLASSDSHAAAPPETTATGSHPLQSQPQSQSRSQSPSQSQSQSQSPSQSQSQPTRPPQLPQLPQLPQWSPPSVPEPIPSQPQSAIAANGLSARAPPLTTTTDDAPVSHPVDTYDTGYSKDQDDVDVETDPGAAACTDPRPPLPYSTQTRSDPVVVAPASPSLESYANASSPTDRRFGHQRSRDEYQDVDQDQLHDDAHLLTPTLATAHADTMMKPYTSPVVGESAWLGSSVSTANANSGGGVKSPSAASGSHYYPAALAAHGAADASSAHANANSGSSSSSSAAAANTHAAHLGPGLHPLPHSFGTSPSAQSDHSNEAQIHGMSTSSLDPAELSPNSHHAYSSAYQRQQQQHHHHHQQHQHQLQHSQPSDDHLDQAQQQSYLAASPHAADADRDLRHPPPPFRMSGIETSDGRPSIQSVRSINDPNASATSPNALGYDAHSGYASVTATPTSADAPHSGRSGQSSVDATPGAMSMSMSMSNSHSYGDGSHGNLSGSSSGGVGAGAVGSNGMIHAPASFGGATGGGGGGSGGGNGGALGPAVDEIVPTTFDEGMLRALCDMDCGMPLLFDRIKQSTVSAREAAIFLKKRAAIEEEYARNLTKLSRLTLETYSMSDAKAGSYVGSWQSIMKTHEAVADNRIRFASKLAEMSDELNNLAREVDKNRKQTKDTGQRLEKNLTDAEAGVEKARARFDATAEDLERLLLLKSGESTKGGELAPGGKRTLGKAIGKSGLLFKNKNPQQILKQEEEIRARTSNASDTFRKEVLNTQGIRQEYFNLQLPRILRSLKESAEEIDNGTQYHLARYAFLFESTLLNDGMTISPVGPDVTPTAGLKAAVEAIDNRGDFKSYMQNYQVVHGSSYRGPRREGPYEEGFLPALLSPTAAAHSKGAQQSRSAPTRPVFGVDLAVQMTRDGVDVPPILEKCAEAIEAHGLTSMGIYRLSGTTSKVQRLKAKFNEDWEQVDLMADEEAMSDINIVAGCLKLWFRELPEPLLTYDLYAGFIEAAKVENERLRHIRLHERVNELPDANYATLKYLMAHLDRVKSEDHVNQMSSSNLAIVFGPTLLSPPPPGSAGIDSGGAPSSGGAAGAGGGNGGSGMHLQDMSFQCRAVETILEKYREIFVDEEE
ncbi:Rho GTPase-activating protein [Thecaphora frezii]